MIGPDFAGAVLAVVVLAGAVLAGELGCRSLCNSARLAFSA